MADNAIRKRTDAVIKNERNLFKVKEDLKAQCTHTIHGEPSFIPSNEPKVEGLHKYICKQCQKVITITSIDEEELQKACDLIDRAIDIIKITASSSSANNEDDAEVMHKLAKMQYRIRNDLMPTYKAALKKSNNRANKHNNNNNNSESSWGRPTTYGHDR